MSGHGCGRSFYSFCSFYRIFFELLCLELSEKAITSSQQASSLNNTQVPQQSELKIPNISISPFPSTSYKLIINLICCIFYTFCIALRHIRILNRVCDSYDFFIQPRIPPPLEGRRHSLCPPLTFGHIIQVCFTSYSNRVLRSHNQVTIRSYPFELHTECAHKTFSYVTQIQ